MNIFQTLNRLPHPPASLLFQPVRTLPWELRNKTLAMALNNIFQEPLEEGEFEDLEGRWLQITVSDLKLDFYLSLNDQQFTLSAPRPCDVTITGNSTDFLAMASRREDPDTLFFHRRMTFEGDTELGLAVKNMLDALELDQLPATLQWAIQTSDSWSQKLRVVNK